MLIFYLDVFLLTLLMIKELILFQKNKSLGQIERELGPKTHRIKNHTPTMAGIAFILGTILFLGLNTLLFAYDFHTFLLLVIPFLGYGILGFIDDVLILTKGKNDGIKPSMKFFLQIILAAFYFYLYLSFGFDTTINLYFFQWDLKFLYGIFILLAFSGFSNATNLTDGIDGLLGSTFLITLFGFGLIINETIINDYILLLMVALLAFLRFNLPKAEIFMGNTGALALGAMMVSIAVVSKVEIFIFIFGLLYLIEVLSVILQVGYFRLTKGKRLFKMAPLHHHFEIIYQSEIKTLFIMVLWQLLFVLIGIIIAFWLI